MPASVTRQRSLWFFIFQPPRTFHFAASLRSDVAMREINSKSSAANYWEVLLQLHSILTAQYPIQIECGANQCKMCEGLRKIPQRLALRPGLLCVESEMIGITQHTFE